MRERDEKKNYLISGEICQLQSEILHCEGLREAMAVEMTKLTEKAEQVGGASHQLLLSKKSFRPYGTVPYVAVLWIRNYFFADPDPTF